MMDKNEIQNQLNHTMQNIVLINEIINRETNSLFKCTHPDCVKSNREFSEAGLSQHMKTKHEIQNQLSHTTQDTVLINKTRNLETNNVFKCTHPDCLKSIREFSEAGLSQHMKTKHEIQNQLSQTMQEIFETNNLFKCTHPDCIKSSREFSEAGLSQHMMDKHEIQNQLNDKTQDVFLINEAGNHETNSLFRYTHPDYINFSMNFPTNYVQEFSETDGIFRYMNDKYESQLLSQSEQNISETINLETNSLFKYTHPDYINSSINFPTNYAQEFSETDGIFDTRMINTNRSYFPNQTRI